MSIPMPEWWNRKGQGMILKPREPDTKYLTLSNHEECILSLSRGRAKYPIYRMSWRVLHPFGETKGWIRVYADDIRRIFGLKDGDMERTNQRVGHYIRNGPYLNIPAPGIGRDGDPNLSIFITPEIQAAVRKLLPE